jgi:hypothetical protein
MRTQIVMGLLILCLSLSLFISGCAKTEKLPDNFAMDLYSDSTSSGATRESYARLAFNDGKIVDGYDKYHFQDMNQDILTECVVDLGTMSWINATTNGDTIELTDPYQNCTLRMIFDEIKYPDGSSGFDNYREVPITKEGIQKLIDDKTIVPRTEEDPYCHYQICYEIELFP